MLKSKLFYFLTILSLLILSGYLQAQELITYANIPGRASSDHYKCRVRQVGSTEWQDAFVLQTISKPRINNPDGSNQNGYTTILENWTASWMAFEFSGTPVEVEISKVGGAAITKAMVRPVGHASVATIENGKAYITFDEPANVNVDIDGQMEDQYTGMGYSGPPVHTISLFANPIFKEPNLANPKVLALNPGESIPADRNTWDTIYFMPGIHRIGTPFQISSEKVLYIPGNAVVHGTIHPPDAWGAQAAHSWSVYGSGALSSEEVARAPGQKWNKPFTNQANRVHLEGFVVVDPAHHTFNMNNNETNPAYFNVYKNLKILGWRINGDGLNAFRNSEITDCFFRVQDDHFYYGGDNVRISHNVCWSDYNGAVLYVTKGAIDLETSYFKDIKVIYHRAGWHYWDGGRVISFRSRTPGNVIRNVNIQNVLVEDPFPAFPPFYGFMENPDNSDALMNYDNIIIENVVQEYPGVSHSNDASMGKPRNTLLGLDENRKFRNITFKNCYYNGNWLGSFDDGNFLINQFVEDITFILDNVIPSSNFILRTTAKNGVITLDSAGGIPGEVTVTATPNAGYAFDRWSGDLSGTDSVATITMDRDKAVTAIFLPIAATYSLVTEATNGTISLSPTPSGGSYPWGTEVIATAIGDAGYTFEEWGGDLAGSTNPVTFTMDRNKTISASFVPKSVISVRISNCPSQILKTGETHQLDVIISPADAADQSVTWSSSNPTVATVDENGLIHAMSEGSTIITLVTNDGGFTANCSVGVMSTGIAVTGVTISGCAPDWVNIDSLFQLHATVAPANAGDIRINWTSSDESVAVVSESGWVTTLSAGEAIITATSTLGGLSDECRVKVGMDTNSKTIDKPGQFVDVFPNPASEFLYFRFSESASLKKIDIYNSMGQLLHSKNTYSNNPIIDIREFNSQGLIIVKITAEEGSALFKIIL